MIETKCTVAELAAKMYESHKCFVARTAAKYATYNPLVEACDLEQEAYVNGIYVAATKYVTWATETEWSVDRSWNKYLHLMIRGAMLHYLRDYKYNSTAPKNFTSISTPNVDNSIDCDFRYEVKDNDNNVKNFERKELIKSMIAKIKKHVTPDEWKLLYYTYFAGKPLKEITKIFKSFDSTMCKLRKDLLVKLRNIFELEYSYRLLDRQ
ncbi:MAG: sigma-70 family RNA polymerase sigma factor [Planctomycetaceae bacterium]|jgi:RNA polymerase sigma factor (sigma-70 family)|nr:sigma-70 family RNA polymerase sigma factor [Planctomycetaceae bacterium]